MRRSLIFNALGRCPPGRAGMGGTRERATKRKSRERKIMDRDAHTRPDTVWYKGALAPNRVVGRWQFNVP